MGKHEYVYMFLRSDISDKPIKIGRTWNVRLRARTLENQKKTKLSVVAYLKCQDIWQAMDIEKKFHRMARKGNYKGDWHPFQSDLISKFCSMSGVTLCLHQ